MHSNLALYQAEDFVMDETFRNWVLDSESIHRSFWERYLFQYPHQKNNVQVARILVLGLQQMHHVEPDQEMADSIWSSIQAEIHAEPQEVSYSPLLV
jgi:hypothetical protein